MSASTETIRDAGPRRTAQPASPGVVVVFSEVEVPGDGAYPARPDMTIGRDPGRTVFVGDPAMSRLHAAITFEGGRAAVEDRGSHNGTFVRGRRIHAQTALVPFDVVRCGRSLLAVVPDIQVFAGWRRWGREGPIVGGPSMRAIRGDIATFAASDLEVLLTGETGTGKDLVAGEIHRLSGREGTLVPVNCAAVPEPLFEAELFGARRGAFTGAVSDRPGLVRAAHRGTLFLDEVAELPPGAQAKLLRAVERREVRPLGGEAPVSVDVRVVAATNKDLGRQVERGLFREDLYHRISGVRIALPPLRERLCDIPHLVEHLLASQGGPAPPPSAALVERLMLHAWPGNVRELDRAVREARARASREGAPCLLPRHLRADLDGEGPEEPDAFDAVRDALARSRGNVSRAAAEVGVHRTKIYALLRSRGLGPGDFR